MAATVIFPLAKWQEGTNQNSTPANDNALRIQAAFGPANGFAATAPATPAEYDQWVISTTWSGFAVANIVIYIGGTWKEFASYDGMEKVIAGAPYLRTAGVWGAESAGSGGSPPAYNAQTGTSHDLALTDAPATSTSQGIVSMNNSGANHVLVTKSATVAWVVGTMIQIIQLGTGTTSVLADTGVDIKTAGSLACRAQNSSMVLTYLGANVWLLSGDFA